MLTDERLEESTLEDAHDALDGETQRPVMRMCQSTVVLFEQLQRSVRLCTTRPSDNELLQKWQRQPASQPPHTSWHLRPRALPNFPL